VPFPAIASYDFQLMVFLKTLFPSMDFQLLAMAIYVLHYTYRRNGIEEVVGSIPSGSTTLTSCFCYAF
jgi:hypothetical protein